MRAALVPLTLIAAPAMAQDVNAPGEVAATVYFEWDSTQASAEFDKVLDGLIDKLTARPWKSISVEGHTDNSVSMEYSLGLSNRWAWSVRDKLYDRGVEGGRMKVIAYGRARPAIASEGREVMNRRVEIRVVWE